MRQEARLAAFDILITGGTVVDGTGRPAFRADLAVKGKKIAALGDLHDAVAERVIDATGKVVSPGFIDTHAHSDGALLADPQHANGLRQGITTEVLDQDGLSYAPLKPADYRMYRWYLSGLLGLPPEDLDMSSMSAFLANYHRKVSINVVALVPHGCVRVSTVGMKDAPLKGATLKKAEALVREGMEQGAKGFATGMSYYPNAYSDTAELIALNKVVAELGGVYVTHLRNHHTERGFGGGGVAEALEIGRRSGVKVHFSHYRTSAHNAGKIPEIMADIDQAKREGVDITLECYPYPVGSSFPLSYFHGDFHEGGPVEILKRLKDRKQRAGYIKQIEEMNQESGLAENSWTFIGVDKWKSLEGMYFRDVAAERGVSIAEMICDVIRDTELKCGFRGAPPQSSRLWRMVEQDVMSLVARPDYMIGSDAIPLGSICHPRAYGTFPRVVGRLRRRHGYKLEQVVQRVTQNPAERFQLKGRGVLKKGNFADIVVFDADEITDLSTFEDPRVHPVGIPFVIVNGRVAVDHERCTGVMAGEAL
ncbi:MAG: D-aminoacylase [SAR202 cluster bacterium]|nr:D-aminoacylase [SAR202 cluster bacterium]